MKKCKTSKERQLLRESIRILIGDEDKNGMGSAFKAFSLFPNTLKNIMKLRGGAPDGFRSGLKL